MSNSRKLEKSLLEQLKEMFEKGENLSQYLKSQNLYSIEAAQIIEMAYDLQAGSYIRLHNSNPEFLEQYTEEMMEIIDPFLTNGVSILDAGCGELTTSTVLLNKISNYSINYHAFDISWSRLFKGKTFQKSYDLNLAKNQIFVADISKIPLPEKSIDIVITNHALEPNGSNLDVLLKELIRVTRKKLILFEPWYENNSVEGRARMDSHGYIKDLVNRCKHYDCIVDQVSAMKNLINPLNPTACFIVTPPSEKFYKTNIKSETYLTVPGSEERLEFKDQVYFGKRSGYAFPILKGIPILKLENKIIASLL